MSKLATLRQELAQHQDDLGLCRQLLEAEPDESDTLETVAVLEDQIAEVTAAIAAEEAKVQDAATQPADDAAPKIDMSKHPKFRKVSPENVPPPPPPSTDAPAVFHVGNVVLAKYTADKQWYQATIISKTGSSTDPVYSVTFKGYGNTETNKRKHEVRAIEHAGAGGKKRKADGAVTNAAEVPAHADSAEVVRSNPQAGTVISAAPSVDPSLVQKREPSKVSDGPARLAPEPKKLKGGKALEKSKSSWNAWQQSGPKKTGFGGPKQVNKESQFRTPDLPNAKVGFTGSGKPMQKDQARSRWKYGGADDEFGD